MTWPIMIYAAVTGYLLGSISFSRMVMRKAKAGQELTAIRQQVPGTDEVFEMESYSATAVRIQAGNRFGGLTVILDMLKVMLPVALFKLLFPGQFYFLIVSAAGALGHVWPVYYRFKGGRGESPIYGGLLIFDPLGVLISQIAGMLAGISIGNLVIFRLSGLIWMILWTWLKTRNTWLTFYVVFLNLVYWGRTTTELRQYITYFRKGIHLTQEEIGEFLGVGKRLGRFMDRFSLVVLLNRFQNPKN